jgi:hypothetical protein
MNELRIPEAGGLFSLEVLDSNIDLLLGYVLYID